MISFFFVDLFGSVGVLLGLADSADLLDENGNVPGAGKALFISAAGAAVGAVLGTSTVTIMELKAQQELLKAAVPDW